MRSRLDFNWLVVGLVLAAAPAVAGGLEEWALSVGSFNATKNPSAVEAGVELRWPTRWEGFQAVGGFAGTEDDSYWAYGGGRYTFTLDRRWAFSPGFAVSVYEQGDGKDLGGTVEFRSSFELSYRTGRRSRLGLNFYHLSNAGFYDKNPGSNSLVLVWTRRTAGGRAGAGD